MTMAIAMKKYALWLMAGVLSTSAMGATTGSSPVSKHTPAASTDGGIRVELLSPHAVTLSGEVAARISALKVSEGDSFRQGQTLIEFDCATYRAQLRKAQAVQEAAIQLLKVNHQLAKYNSVGTLELTQAKGKLEEAAADVCYMQTLVSKCTIKAPFDGRVSKRHAAAWQYMTPGAPVLDIVATQDLELRMLVPSKWLPHLTSGTPFQVTIDELGQTFPAKIKRTGAQIDPVSQTIPVIGVISGTTENLLPGMSGWANFN
ncbi:secretion protein HlyD [Mangrovibacter sp. MFB070]|uniref:efflux RND transporter periplasmic adaptor subunit n=1 Tax=Mangrovibacter sp. MFB070 TaxID=1224318 RepID=UPI0004D60BCE|nr:efflux RND transporter periplasmic adaptor subunit [Mangrovibacter sp. MFB070]KEA53906.1 secretion protein HlyD [Mangrovibacter sp. MFB070]